MADLKELLEVHRDAKKKKMIRKSKWDNWKKTQAMFYCKTSTNYNKWDMFESESDPEDKENEEPIVPKNDPKFQAMEADFVDRKRRRIRSRKLAEELKAKGNDAMKRGLYKSAKHHYTEALEHRKDILPLYTNRALVCIKLEEMQMAIDDTSRVLEYCEVFDNGYEKQKDLCYKALMRRGLANKFNKDFDLAKQDFEEAKKIEQEGGTDCEKWLKLNEEDREHHKKINNIMCNADSLKGKEYIDYLIDFLTGKKDKKDLAPTEQEKKNSKKRKQICVHEISIEESMKLSETLQNDDMVYYFSVKEGLKVLVDSLYISTNALDLIQKVLEKHQKLQ